MSASTGAMKALLPKLAKMMTDEYNLHKGVKEGIKYLHKELESMQVALEKVSEVPADQVDRQVKLWARDIRELSYDIEDTIDSYMLRVGADGEPKSPKSCCITIKGMRPTYRARYGIAIEIERIKKEVKEASERRERYRVDDIVVAPPQWLEPRLQALFEDEAKLVGIDRPREELIKLLAVEGDDARNQKPKLVAIVGPGGMGKTTLANLVYKRLQRQFDCRAFVSVSLRPNKKNILSSILRQVSQNVYENTEAWDEMEVIDKIRYVLKDKRYFIVIDDIWDESAWEHIRWILPENNHGSKIITTSRNIGVAQFCCSSNNDVDGIIHELQPLSIVDSEKLFYYKVFQEDGCPPELRDISNKVLKRCDGLPLAIVTIASVFANRQTQTEDQRISVYNSIHTGLENSHDMRVMWGILSLSFYDLPSQLKTCLLYLSIFPEDHIIEKHDLIWRWIAEGFVHAKGDENLYGLGESYFDKLISRSMIQPMNVDTHRRAQACRVHDMVLEFITSLSTEENFVTILNGQHLPSSAKRIRRLSHQNSKDELAIPHANIDLSHARSFFVFWRATDLKLPLSSFQVLRVLDLENCSSGNIEGIGNLVQLRYLRLTATYFIELPKEIGNLQFLHTLDLRGARIKELPSTVVQLRQLGRLYVHTETKLPDEIVNMKSLEELSEINISNYRQNLIKELGNLFGLRVLEMSLRKWDKRYEEPLLECLCNLKKLETLYIFAPDVFLDFMLDVNWGPRYLRRFTACVRRQTEHIFSLSPQHAWFEHCPFSTLPRWINSSLLNLSDLSIMVKKLCQENLEILGNLPTLHFLDLHVHEATVESLLEITGRTVTDHAMAFRCLANFKFMSREMVLVFRQGAMNRLQMLSLSFRFKDTKYAHGDFDLGWENLTSLKALDVGIDCFSAGDSEVKDLEVAMRNAASLNPNHPTLSLSRHYEREMTCEEAEETLELETIKEGELAGLVRIGPWGGNRGRPHDIKVPPCRLKSVTIGSDMVVDSIAFSYSDCNGQQHTAGPWGGYRGSNYTNEEQPWS